MDDPVRFERLWKEAERTVARLILRSAPVEEVDDLLVETRFAAWRGYARFVGDERAFVSFACKVAHHLCRDRWRLRPGGERAKMALTVVGLDPRSADPSPSPYESALVRIALEDAISRINALPARWREALILSLKGETHEEIGAALGTTRRRATQLVDSARSLLLSAAS